MNLTELYRGPLEGFVARRGELAQRLRADDPEAAAAVAKVRKPPATVWAIDQLVVDNPDLVSELLAAGADAADAHRAVSQGMVGPDALRVASMRLRDAVQAATDGALAALISDGHASSEDAARRIRTTLQAAGSGTPSERAALWRGTLEHELQPPGFGAPEPGDDIPDVAAAIAPLRRPAIPERKGSTGAKPKPAPNAAALAAVKRASAERDRAAERARALAETKRQHAQLMADETRRANEEADAAGRAADVAEDAAREARAAVDVAERAGR